MYTKGEGKQKNFKNFKKRREKRTRRRWRRGGQTTKSSFLFSFFLWMTTLKVPRHSPVVAFILVVGIFFWLLSSSMSSPAPSQLSATTASVVVGTRIHRRNAQPGAEIDLNPLQELASQAAAYSDLFIVAVGMERARRRRSILMEKWTPNF